MNLNLPDLTDHKTEYLNADGSVAKTVATLQRYDGINEFQQALLLKGATVNNDFIETVTLQLVMNLNNSEVKVIVSVNGRSKYETETVKMETIAEAVAWSIDILADLEDVLQATYDSRWIEEVEQTELLKELF